MNGSMWVLSVWTCEGWESVGVCESTWACVCVSVYVCDFVNVWGCECVNECVRQYESVGVVCLFCSLFVFLGPKLINAPMSHQADCLRRGEDDTAATPQPHGPTPAVSWAQATLRVHRPGFAPQAPAVGTPPCTLLAPHSKGSAPGCTQPHTPLDLQREAGLLECLQKMSERIFF